MSLALRMTVVAVAVAIAGGAAGYWFARMQQGAVPAAAGGAVAAAAPAAHGPGGAAGVGTGEGAGGDTAGGERQILYYRNPMGLPDTSPVPKKDSMGMDYIPVYADDRPDDSGAVAVSPARIQTLGVKTALVEMRTVDAAVRASGRIEIDERRQVVVAPRFEGWIERLHVNAVGDVVKKGQPLFTAYSPELQSTGEELRIAERLASQSAAHDPLASESARRLAEATRARLRNLQVAGQSGARQVFHAPASGVVLESRPIRFTSIAPTVPSVSASASLTYTLPPLARTASVPTCVSMAAAPAPPTEPPATSCAAVASTSLPGPPASVIEPAVASTRTFAPLRPVMSAFCAAR